MACMEQINTPFSPNIADSGYYGTQHAVKRLTIKCLLALETRKPKDRYMQV